ncbi:helix-turn-helix domain-containing protein [Mycobacterium heidelbergense]|uniref:helix-turn-helix domain-containing protein n=1 Tax=Mycobacterium heidelbergense TaxID=53376 RepID=UPI003CEB81AD
MAASAYPRSPQQEAVSTHVRGCFTAGAIALKSRRPQSAESSVLAARMAKSGGLSGKIRVMSWERLATEVRLRRKQLKLTQTDVAERGGLSVATVRAVETNRSGRLSRRLRRALERAIEWQDGSVDVVLDGGTPRAAGAPSVAAGPPASADTARAAAERFAVAQRLVTMRQAFLEHRDHMSEAARTAMDEEFSAASRETEEALIWMLPWLGDDERAEAIRILAELREIRP